RATPPRVAFGARHQKAKRPGKTPGRHETCLGRETCPEIYQPLEIHCASFCFGAAPTWRDAISPPLNISRVGIDMMPYFDAVFGFSSTLSLTILTLSPTSPAISSSAGAIMRQGPHHSAQKSTTTGPSALRTCDSKSASDT